MKKHQIGDTLYFVSSHTNRFNKEVKITKVGRVWLTLDNRMRANTETLTCDGRGYPSPGQCWASEDDYNASICLQNAWSSLCKALAFRKMPKGVTEEDISQARNLLKI